jgi:hypothetical protein
MTVHHRDDEHVAFFQGVQNSVGRESWPISIPLLLAAALYAVSVGLRLYGSFILLT